MNTGETIALIKAFGKGSGGSGSLPSVTSSDNGKVLAVKDGAWAADSNLFVAEFSGSPLTCNKTYQEIVDAVNAGMTVIGVRGNDVYIYSGKDTTNVIFTRISGKNLTVARIALSSSNTAQAAGASLAPATTSFDDGCELIVKNGAWAKQQKKFVVTLTPTSPDYSGTMDKTPAEITAAYGAGQEIVFDIPSMNAKINATQFLLVDDVIRAGGMVFYDVNSSPVIITVITDSSASTYATQVFAMTPAS